MFLCKITKRLMTFVVITSLSTFTLEAQWVQRGGPNGDYRLGSMLEDKEYAWTKSMGVSDSESIVYRDSVLLTSADYAETGGDATRVTCLDRRTGDMQWSVSFPENSYVSQDISDRYPVRPVATPCVAGDSIVCVGFGGSVRCIHISDGSLKWECDLVKDYGAEPIQYGFAGSPWSDGTQVLVPCGGATGTILSFDALAGKLNWKCGTDEASYCSFVTFELESGEKQIVYAAKNELMAVDPIRGSIVWRYAYPKPGLTNTVTPLFVSKGRLLIGGQGVEGTRLLSIRRDTQIELESSSLRMRYQVEEVWSSNRQQPFYCNWVQLQSNPNWVTGFAGKTLFVLDWSTGKIVSQTRGWTDCNVISTHDGAIAVRGDGFIGKLTFHDGKPVLMQGYDKLRDRVWCPPSVSDGNLILRGRRAVTSIPITALNSEMKPTSGTAVTSMDAMYGEKAEVLESLLSKAKSNDNVFTWDDYQKALSDPSSQLSDGEYSQILKALVEKSQSNLGLRIVVDWCERQPFSIPAFQQRMELLRSLGREGEAMLEERERSVEISIVASIPESQETPNGIYIVGNAAELGNWAGKGIRLTKGNDKKWRASVKIPKGDLQFKATGGSWDSVELRADRRSISNRRVRIQSPKEIQIEVATLKSSKPQ